MAQITIETKESSDYIHFQFVQQPNMEELATKIRKGISKNELLPDNHLRLKLDFSLLDDLDYSKTLLMRILSAIIHHHGIKEVVCILPKQTGRDPVSDWSSSWSRISQHTRNAPVFKFDYTV